MFSKAHGDEEILHSLDVRKALAFYPDCTKPFRSSAQFFVAVVNRAKGRSVSAQRLSLWISLRICLCDQLANITPPTRVLAHSSRVQFAGGLFYNNCSGRLRAHLHVNLLVRHLQENGHVQALKKKKPFSTFP